MQFALWPPDIGKSTIVSAILYVAGPLFLVDGMHARSSRLVPVWHHAAWLAVIVGLLCYFYYLDDNLRVRAYILNIGMGGIVLGGAWRLRDLLHGNIGDRAMVWLLCGLGLALLGRTLLTAGSIPADNVESFFESPFWIWAQIGMSVFGVAMGICLLAVAGFDMMLALKAERDTDALTGLLNRRGLQGREPPLLATGRPKPVCIVACDIDRFKGINDRFGHAAGDLVLLTFAGTIRKVLEGADVAARIGGEEFVIVMNDVSIGSAFKVTECLRRELADKRFEGLPEDLSVTCSFGISQFLPGEGLFDAIARADKILYAAKRAGRNRTFAEGLQLPSAA
ncbi:GGDEF domain-containing protein [Mesorhizobium sp. ANAO-SY3R2]|uniref:GGDEF domain-containing protein n=1 Tax=Mesorhizobium sp. ANAO-SY3R2 TaxID=3166644 RepID=UPI00366F3642